MGGCVTDTNKGSRGKEPNSVSLRASSQIHGDIEDWKSMKCRKNVIYLSRRKDILSCHRNDDASQKEQP